MRKKILIIDDEKTTRMTLTKCLTSAGYEVCEAENGKKGVAKAKEEAPDLILLDIVMPEVDGVEAVDFLKCDKKTRSTPIIFLTGLLKEDDVRDGYVEGSKVGNQYFIAKPFKRDELLEMVDRCIGQP